MPLFSPPGQPVPAHTEPSQLLAPIKRRSFFMYAGATAGATALVLAGCSKSDTATPSLTDVDVLNYAYALKQLTAAFYAQVVKTPATDFQSGELAYLTRMGTHEAIHRDFLKAAINRDAPGQLGPDLTVNFASIDFTKRATVLATAIAFEDTATQAFNGAGAYFTNAAYLVLAGKMVSVNARHSAYVRDQLYPGDAANFFAGDNVTDPGSGLDKASKPAAVVAIVQKYVVQTLDVSKFG